MKKYKILLIDATNVFIKMYSVDKSINEFGMPIGGLVGFIKQIKIFIEKFNPNEIILIFDSHNNSKRKQRIDEEYKKGRKFTSYINSKDPMQNKEIFEQQLGKLYKFLDYLPFKVLKVDNSEADDIIAFSHKILSNYSDNFEFVIISNDNDFYQLINENTVQYDHRKKEIIDVKMFTELFNFLPYNYHIYKTLAGDTSDSVKRVMRTKNIIDGFKDILEGEKFYDLMDLETYIKENKIDIDLESVKNNYNLVQLHEPNISTTNKLLIIEKIKKINTVNYGMTNLKVMINVFGITKFVYQDFFSYINIFKLKFNEYNNFLIQLKKEYEK